MVRSSFVKPSEISVRAVAETIQLGLARDFVTKRSSFIFRTSIEQEKAEKQVVGRVHECATFMFNAVRSKYTILQWFQHG